LDRNRCPMVQTIDDNKGVHIVASVNLYESVPEARLVGLGVCRELRDKRVGASVEVAFGPVFCGVTGGNLACRWDITGPDIVLPARLMQFALSRKDLDFAIDKSLYADPMAATHMALVETYFFKGLGGIFTLYLSHGNMLHSILFRTNTAVYTKPRWIKFRIIFKAGTGVLSW
jgi:hypothetical protein